MSLTIYDPTLPNVSVPKDLFEISAPYKPKYSNQSNQYTQFRVNYRDEEQEGIIYPQPLFVQSEPIHLPRGPFKKEDRAAETFIFNKEDNSLLLSFMRQTEDRLKEMILADSFRQYLPDETKKRIVDGNVLKSTLNERLFVNPSKFCKTFCWTGEELYEGRWAGGQYQAILELRNLFLGKSDSQPYAFYPQWRICQLRYDPCDAEFLDHSFLFKKPQSPQKTLSTQSTQTMEQEEEEEPTPGPSKRSYADASIDLDVDTEDLLACYDEWEKKNQMPPPPPPTDSTNKKRKSSKRKA